MTKPSSHYFHSRPFLFFMSLGISVLLWFFVTSNRDRGISRDLATSLELHNVPRDLVILGAPETVEVRIAGSATQLSRLSPESVHAFVNLQGLHPGDYTLPVRAELPPTFELKEISPAEVPLRLVAMESHSFSPEVRIRGTFSEGVSLVEAEILPKEAVVTAPAEVFESLSTVVAEVWAQRLEKEEGKTISPVFLEAEGDFARSRGLVQIEPAEVEVRFSLARKIEKKLVDISPVLQGEVSKDYHIQEILVSPPQVLLSGKPGSLKGISSVDTSPMDVSGVAGEISQSLELVLPPVEGLVADPRKVSVSLKIIPRRGEKTLSEVALKVKGKSIYPQWEVFPRSVTVYVEGPVMLLDSLDSSSVEAFVDVTNLVSRKISVPIRVSLGAKELRVIGTAPENATVYAKIDD